MIQLLFLILTLFLSCTQGIHDIELSDIEGNKVYLSEYRDKPLVVYVWSGTCIGHTEDMKRLITLYPKIKDKAQLISIAVMMNPQDVKVFLKKTKIKPNYEILSDEKGKFAQRVTLVFLPATLIFDKKGKLVESYPGLPRDLISLIPTH